MQVKGRKKTKTGSGKSQQDRWGWILQNKKNIWTENSDRNWAHVTAASLFPRMENVTVQKLKSTNRLKEKYRCNTDVLLLQELTRAPNENNQINVSSCPRYVFKNYVWAAVKIHTSRRSRRASEMVRHISGELLTVYDVKRQQMIKNNSQTCFGHYLLSPASATASSLYNTPQKNNILRPSPA